MLSVLSYPAMIKKRQARTHAFSNQLAIFHPRHLFAILSRRDNHLERSIGEQFAYHKR